MTLFIQDSPWDYLMYYPLIKELERKKSHWRILNLHDKSMSDLIVGLSTGDVSSVVIWGGLGAKANGYAYVEGYGSQDLPPRRRPAPSVLRPRPLTEFNSTRNVIPSMVEFGV